MTIPRRPANSAQRPPVVGLNAALLEVVAEGAAELGAVPLAALPEALAVPLEAALEAGAAPATAGEALACAPTPVRVPAFCAGRLDRALEALTKLARVLPELGGLMALTEERRLVYYSKYWRKNTYPTIPLIQ
jgi:hypothetical protein